MWAYIACFFGGIYLGFFLAAFCVAAKNNDMEDINYEIEQD